MKISHSFLAAFVVFAAVSVGASSAQAAVKEYWATQLIDGKPTLQTMSTSSGDLKNWRTYPSQSQITTALLRTVPSRNTMIYLKFNVDGQRDGIYKSSVLGGSEKLLVSGYFCETESECPEPTISDISLSSNGRFVLYMKRGAWRVMDTITGGVKTFSYQKSGIPNFSPSGEQLIEVRNANQVPMYIRFTNLITGIATTTKFALGAPTAHLSPNDYWMVIAGRRFSSDPFQIRLYNTVTMKLASRLTQSDPVSSWPVWLDRSRFAIFSSESDTINDTSVIIYRSVDGHLRRERKTTVPLFYGYLEAVDSSHVLIYTREATDSSTGYGLLDVITGRVTMLDTPSTDDEDALFLLGPRPSK